MPSSRKVLSTALCSLIILLGACQQSFQSRDITSQIPPENTVEIVLDQTVEVSTALSSDRFRRESVSEMASIGAGAGLLTSFACGPLFIVCVAPLAGVGGIIGAGAAGVYTGFSDFSEEDAENLAESLASIAGSVNPSEHFMTSFMESANGNWQIVSQNADASITIGLNSINLSRITPTTFAIETEGYLSDGTIPFGRTMDVYKYVFTNLGPERELSEFLDQNGEELKTEIEQGIEDLVSKMIFVLERGGRRDYLFVESREFERTYDEVWAAVLSGLNDTKLKLQSENQTNGTMLAAYRTLFSSATVKITIRQLAEDSSKVSVLSNQADPNVGINGEYWPLIILDSLSERLE
jgi:hypothetical protein